MSQSVKTGFHGKFLGHTVGESCIHDSDFRREAPAPDADLQLFIRKNGSLAEFAAGSGGGGYGYDGQEFVRCRKALEQLFTQACCTGGCHRCTFGQIDGVAATEAYYELYVVFVNQLPGHLYAPPAVQIRKITNLTYCPNHPQDNLSSDM